MELGVNIDHVATLRQARGTVYPDPIEAAHVAEEAGADLITLHLREDRRHIVDSDVELLRDRIQSRMNLEIGATNSMIDIACRIKPDDVCLVPERREELTTEGGLNVVEGSAELLKMTSQLKSAGIRVSMFIDPEESQIRASGFVGAEAVEIHTGAFADATNAEQKNYEYHRVIKAAAFAANEGLRVNAGHGLHYSNVGDIARIDAIKELNIGHSIIARAVFSGLSAAVRDMKTTIDQAVKKAHRTTIRQST